MRDAWGEGGGGGGGSVKGVSQAAFCVGYTEDLPHMTIVGIF